MRKLILAALACLVFIFAGCGQPGLLEKMANAKLGVTWQGEPSYSWLVSKEIKKRTKLTVQDEQNLPALADYESVQARTQLKEQHKLDYILVCTPVYIGPVEQKSHFSVSKGVRISVDYMRKVQLSYQLIEVASGQVLSSGVVEGIGTHSTYIRFDGNSASGRLVPQSEEELLMRAIENAIRRSELL